MRASRRNEGVWGSRSLEWDGIARDASVVPVEGHEPARAAL
jgi:hypothetical protein